MQKLECKDNSFIKLVTYTYFYIFAYKNPNIEVAVILLILIAYIYFYFFAYKNYNIKANILIIDISIVKAFVSNIFLVIFDFLIKKLQFKDSSYIKLIVWIYIYFFVHKNYNIKKYKKR